MGNPESSERVLISFDYALKRLLRNKANYEILEGFLSELLMRNITVKNLGESESNKDHSTDKYNRVDVLVEDEEGEILLIELQFSIEMDFLQRMLYGTSKALTERMVQGTEYMEVKKIYSINIVYFDLGQGKDYVYHGKTHFKGLHRNDELRLSQAQRDTFGKEMPGDIYPEYYILKVNNFDDIAKDTLDEWIYFLKHSTVRDDFTAKGLSKAREILDRDKLSFEERQAYDYLLNQRSHDLSMIASSKLEGRIEGREEGRIEREKLAKDLEKEHEEREKLAKDLEKEREELKAVLAELDRLRK